VLTLEVIDKGQCTDEHRAPLLFVHGGWHGAWCWDEYFLDFFVERGYRAVALSLRGHGNSPAGKRMQACRVTDYVEDVGSAADNLPSNPVVIGHSLGGFVVQKYLESYDAPAGILLASMPARGAGGFLWREAKRHPVHTLRATLTTKTLHGYKTPKLAREHFFSPKTPEADVARYAARLEEEYGGRIVFDEVFANLPEPRRVKAPLLVLGAACDGCFTVDEIRSTARAYNTEAEIFPGMGHNMMLEPGWADVVERIHEWLSTRGL
jgi:pimeloyl-ACP methyl ester carboxylesterase